MPSQKKTKNLKLNQWQENEYPKMIDFNDDNQKIDDAFGKIEQKVTEGVENLDISGKQIEFVEAITRILPQTGDTLKTIVSKIVKHLKDLKAVAFTGKYSDLTGVPTSFTPAAHNHDDRYLGKREKAESAKRADVATTAEQVQGFKFRRQDGKLEVLVEGEWIRVGGRQYTKTRVINCFFRKEDNEPSGSKKYITYSGSAGMLKTLKTYGAIRISKIIIDGESVSMPSSTIFESFLGLNPYFSIFGTSVGTNGDHCFSYVGLEFKNSLQIEVTKLSSISNGSDVVCTLQTEK